MKIKVINQQKHEDTLDIIGPFSIMSHPNKFLDILSDDGTNIEHYFTKDGYYDGYGFILPAMDMTGEEAKAMIKTLNEGNLTKKN